MADFCDRSPCASMLAALGRYVFGNVETGAYTLLTRLADGKTQPVAIDYCPFCGTRLTNLEMVASGEMIYVPTDLGS